MTPAIKADRIVIGAQSNDHSAHLAGVSSKRFFTDADTFARVQLLVTEYYQIDAPINFWDVYRSKPKRWDKQLFIIRGGFLTPTAPGP